MGGDLDIGLDRPVPVWMSTDHFSCWKHAHFTLDVVTATADTDSVEASYGIRFAMRLRLLTDAGATALRTQGAPPGPPAEPRREPATATSRRTATITPESPSLHPTESSGPEPSPHTESTTMTETAPAPVGNPAIVGLPAFLVGATALGLYLTGFISPAAVGASIPIILTATGIGLIIATLWAARLGQNAVASVFGVFAGFWISYAALVLGLVHGWFGLAAEDVTKAQEVYLISWLLVLALLTLGTLRLPVAFTLLFVLVDLAVFLVFLGTANASTNLVKLGGYGVFGFVAVGAYLYLGTLFGETGGKSLPLGRSIQSA